MLSLVGIFTTIPFYINEEGYKVDAALYVNLASFLTGFVLLISYGYSLNDRITCCNFKLMATFLAFVFSIAFMVCIFIENSVLLLDKTSSEKAGLVLLFTMIINFSLYVFRAILGLVIYLSRRNGTTDLSYLY